MLKFEDNYPLKNITTLQIGGPAKKFVVVKSKGELIEAIEHAKRLQRPYLVIGGGSNILVSDEGVDCLVIKNKITGISSSKVSSLVPSVVEGGSFEVKIISGTPLQELVDYTISHGLSGLQKLTGIPGTVGGAVYGNAGAYGQTISDYITHVVIINSSSVILSEATPKAGETKNLFTLSKNKCAFSYRDSIFKKTRDTILEVHFQLEPGDTKKLQEEAKEVLVKRLIKYPPGIKCPGSFFKNIVAETLPKEVLVNIPPEKIVYGKVLAGALLEAVGAKGQKSDGIEIASYHANLFINKGGSAKAFYDLAKTYVEKVKEKYGITLEPEVQLINLPPLT